MIEIRVDDRRVMGVLQDLSRNAADLSPAMKRVAGIMHDAVEENFEDEGRPRWKPLSPVTIRERTKKGYWPGRMLQRAGGLAASISQRYDSRSAAVGTNKRYAAIQQFGGPAGRGRKVVIPPRPFLKLTPGDLDRIKRALAEYLKD